MVLIYNNKFLYQQISVNMMSKAKAKQIKGLSKWFVIDLSINDFGFLHIELILDSTGKGGYYLNQQSQSVISYITGQSPFVNIS